jgi:CRP-like cAMP-binding protein
VNVPPNHSYRNKILSSLPKAVTARLAAGLSPVTLVHNQPLLDDGQTATDAYFLEDGVASYVVTTRDGRTVEAGIIGRCGMVGIPVLLGTRSMPGRTFVQIPGSGFRLSAEIVRHEFDRLGEFRRRLLRYLQARIIQTSQSAACNRLHGVDQRLARWLLLCRDQMDSDRLLLTQEFLSQMLGAPRTTVTLAAGMLQKGGLIESSRGDLLIVNRKGLEDVACECYGVISAEYARLTI